MEGVDTLTNETVELLQTLIRNQCVNDGTITSGDEYKSVDVLESLLEDTSADVETFEVQPGRKSLIARLAGTDPEAPSLCLMGHTDVVPVSPDGWSRDPFGGELVNGEVWGRGAVDMLNLTSSMAVVFRHLASSAKRYPGDIVYFAVADEEAGGHHGAEVLVRDSWDMLKCDFVLTEYGGMSIDGQNAEEPLRVVLHAGEKGVAWRRLRVKGQPGHGSMPYGTDNALVKAAEVVRRLAEYSPKAELHKLWQSTVAGLDLGPELNELLLDPVKLEETLPALPDGLAAYAHACTHTTFSPNVAVGGTKTNIIPDEIAIEVDIRTLPGETSADVDEHLNAALGPLMAAIDVEVINQSESTTSEIAGVLWDALSSSIADLVPGATTVPSLATGGTDARFFRERGIPSYGAGLLSPKLDVSEFARRFHGHDERIDVESLSLTVQLWLGVCDRLWSDAN